MVSVAACRRKDAELHAAAMALTVTVKSIPISKLNVHHYEDEEQKGGYQRPLSDEWVDKTARFGIADVALGTITVGQRPDKGYWVVDGQHRVQLGREEGREEMLCCVFQSTGPALEAYVHDMLATQRKQSVYDKFQAGLAKFDPECVAIANICQQAGFDLRSQRKKLSHLVAGRLNCLEIVIDTYQHRRNLEQTLRLIANCWMEDKDAMRNTVVGGLSMFLFYYKDEPGFDMQHLEAKLLHPKGSAAVLFRDSHVLLQQFAIGGHAPKFALAEAIRNHFNKGYRGIRLRPLATVKDEHKLKRLASK